MYENTWISLASRFRFDIQLESCCNGIAKNDAQYIAQLIGKEGNFVFSLDQNNILRQLNLHIYSYDKNDLQNLCDIAGITKKILPLTNKWFLSVSMSQAYGLIKNCLPFLNRKRHIFCSFINFYEERKRVRNSDDIAKLEIIVNDLKDKINTFKRNKSGPC